MRTHASPRWSLALALALGTLVLFLAACGGGKKSAAPPTFDSDTGDGRATATSSPAPSTTPAPAPPEMIGGVPVTPLHAGAPADIPANAVLYVESGCTGCDIPAVALDRVYRDGAGVVHTDRLFERQMPVVDGTPMEQNYIRPIGVAEGGYGIVIGVCDRGYCGGVGNSTGDANTTFYASDDAGISCRTIGSLSGDTYIYGVTATPTVGAWVRHAYQPVPGGPYTFEMVGIPSGQPMTLDPSVDVKTATFIPVGGSSPPLVLADDGMSLLWPPGPIAGASPWFGATLPAGSKITDARVSPPGATGGSLLVRWISAETGKGYLGLVDGRVAPPKTIYAENSDASVARMGTWLASSFLVGNMTLPAAALATPAASSGSIWGVPAVTDLATGEVHAIQPLVDRAIAGDRTRIVGAAAGPFVKIAGAGDCLNVRTQPSRTASSLGCFKDGVLLVDRQETRAADGLTWISVAAPNGAPGWASAEFLDAPGRTKTPTPAAHPAGTRTGNPAIDPVIAALETGDPAKIRTVTTFSPIPCLPAGPGLGAPPVCPPGAPSGTPVNALPVGCGEGTYVLPENFERNPEFGLFKQNGLYAIYRSQEQGGSTGWPGGDYVLLYGGVTEFSTLIDVKEGHIIRASFCQPRAFDIIQRIPPADIVLSPPR